MVLARHLAPVGAERREVRVAGQVGVDFGEFDALRFGERLRVHRGAADHHRRPAVRGSERIGIGEARRHLHARRGKVALTRQNDVQALRQRPADGLERRPAHDHGVAERGALEVRQIRRQMPGQRAVGADHPAARDRHHQHDLGRRPHTATGARMAGCGS